MIKITLIISFMFSIVAMAEPIFRQYDSVNDNFSGLEIIRNDNGFVLIGDTCEKVDSVIDALKTLNINNDSIPVINQMSLLNPMSEAFCQMNYTDNSYEGCQKDITNYLPVEIKRNLLIKKKSFSSANCFNTVIQYLTGSKAKQYANDIEISNIVESSFCEETQTPKPGSIGVVYDNIFIFKYNHVFVYITDEFIYETKAPGYKNYPKIMHFDAIKGKYSLAEDCISPNKKQFQKCPSPLVYYDCDKKAIQNELSKVDLPSEIVNFLEGEYLNTIDNGKKIVPKNFGDKISEVMKKIYSMKNHLSTFQYKYFMYKAHSLAETLILEGAEMGYPKPGEEWSINLNYTVKKILYKMDGNIDFNTAAHLYHSKVAFINSGHLNWLSDGLDEMDQLALKKFFILVQNFNNDAERTDLYKKIKDKYSRTEIEKKLNDKWFKHILDKVFR